MNIIGREIDQEKVDYIVSKVKEKQELSGIDNSIVLEEFKKELSKNSKLTDSFLSGKLFAQKTIVKLVRNTLRRMHGTFNVDIKKRNELINLYIEQRRKKYIVDLLKTHKSSEERIGIYESLYHNIFEITKQPSSILDLGCGLNPLSSIFFESSEINYLAFDISVDDLKLIDTFFKSNDNITGETKIINLFDAKSKNIFSKMGHFDICFLFKLLDSIELSKSHKLSEIIIKGVPADWLIVSFATKTVSGKKMNYPGRGWFERMLGRLNYFHRKLVYDNEVFYIVKKLEESKKLTDDYN